jgi:predicted HD phosphohydrolase
LLHDYGHFIIEDPTQLVSKSVDGKHENVAFNFLKNYFKQEVVEPIKLHVQAKRYLCRNKSYWNILSEASKVSLKLQGGIMSDDETKKFISSKFHDDSILLRKYDDEGKIPNIKVKKIEDYRNLINSQLI